MHQGHNNNNNNSLVKPQQMLAYSYSNQLPGLNSAQNQANADYAPMSETTPFSPLTATQGLPSNVLIQSNEFVPAEPSISGGVSRQSV